MNKRFRKYTKKFLQINIKCGFKDIKKEGRKREEGLNPFEP